MVTKVLLVVLAMSRNHYESEKEFMAPRSYTVKSACEHYEAKDCEIRVKRTVYCMGNFGEGACDEWSLWGVKKK